MKKCTIIIQARMGSTRLPGKVMKEIYGKTMLTHMLERVKQLKNVDEILVATSTSMDDEAIVEESKKNDIESFRGSEQDVLQRYFQVAVKSKSDVIVRVTSDCPLIDPFVSDRIIKCYMDNEYDFVTCGGFDRSKKTFPLGLETEVFGIEMLELANKNAKSTIEREHVSPYIYHNSKNRFHYMQEKDYSWHRWTLDYIEDFEFFKKVYSYLYKGIHNFYMEDVIKLIEEHPEITKINYHIPH